MASVLILQVQVSSLAWKDQNKFYLGYYIHFITNVLLQLSPLQGHILNHVLEILVSSLSWAGVGKAASKCV